MLPHAFAALGPRLHKVLRSRLFWVALPTIAALILYLSTVQTHINGAQHSFTTDVGEIQNALPRWGLIHRSGYPLYTAVGSLFVTLLRAVGIEPAAGASLYSTLWATVSVWLLTLLALELGASGPAAALGSISAAVATAMWVNASVAEVHSLTMAFTVATLLLALKFGRSGEQRHLLLLTLAFTQGIAHQRSVVLLAPAVALLIWPRWRAAWRSSGRLVVPALLAPLTYLYLPLRVWTGATWVFGSPGTWHGFWEMLFDNRAGRVVALSSGLQGWAERATGLLGALADDLPWPLLVLGLTGLLLPALKGQRRAALSLALSWVLNLLLTLAIWVGYVGDAQLAAKLPVVILAGVGLAFGLDFLAERWRPAGTVAAAALALALIGWSWRVRPFVVSLTRDRSAEAVIATAAQVAPPPPGQPTTLAIPWGHDYWAVIYAQTYLGQVPGLAVVDHNVDLRAVVERGDRLLTLSSAFYWMPVEWWERRLGRVHLAMAAPGVVELGTTPPVSAGEVADGAGFDLQNGLRVRTAALAWSEPRRLLVTVDWEASQQVQEDYSVAVHLVGHDPPRDAADVLSQADSLHPVAGWYPTSRWSAGEIVRDCYVLEVPAGSEPVAVRVALYRLDPTGQIINSPWLSLPLPPLATGG